MNHSVKVVPVVLLAFVLPGCTTVGGATTSTSRAAASRPSAVVAAADGGSDLGNDRPLVTNDGLMVRRRVAIAIHSTPGANLASLRKELDTAATRSHTSLSSSAPGVLPPALLEPDSPAMTLVLPPGESLAAARKLLDPATSTGRRLPAVARYDVASVLVHDLRFTVSSAKPADLAAAIAREGILSDALGNYTSTLGRQQVDFTYTGPLLSDELVESVRAGIARRASTQPAAVTISPRSTTGVGVDMAKEPAPTPAVTEAPTAHNHGAEQSHR
jgi:hypothetical protein